MRLIALDVETGGLNPSTCALLSIGLVEMDSSLQVKKQTEIFIKPSSSLLIESKAALMNGYSEAFWQEKKAMPLKDALNEVRLWCGNGVEIIAHNAGFDRGFIQAAEQQSGLPLYFNRSWHCSMAAFKAVNTAFNLGHDKCSLDYAARVVGHWSNDFKRGVHGALEDALASAAVYRWCIQRMRDGLVGQRELQLKR